MSTIFVFLTFDPADPFAGMTMEFVPSLTVALFPVIVLMKVYWRTALGNAPPVPIAFVVEPHLEV